VLEKVRHHYYAKNSKNLRYRRKVTWEILVLFKYITSRTRGMKLPQIPSPQARHQEAQRQLRLSHGVLEGTDNSVGLQLRDRILNRLELQRRAAGPSLSNGGGWRRAAWLLADEHLRGASQSRGHTLAPGLL
jgi:hypothetical protein